MRCYETVVPVPRRPPLWLYGGTMRSPFSHIRSQSRPGSPTPAEARSSALPVQHESARDSGAGPPVPAVSGAPPLTPQGPHELFNCLTAVTGYEDLAGRLAKLDAKADRFLCQVVAAERRTKVLLDQEGTTRGPSGASLTCNADCESVRDCPEWIRLCSSGSATGR